MLTGKGRLPLRSGWCSDIKLLYQSIIPGSSSDIKTAIVDFSLGRNTTVTLKWWNGEAWVEPTFYQKLLGIQEEKWATPSPATLSEAINRIASLIYTLNSDTPIP